MPRILRLALIIVLAMSAVPASAEDGFQNAPFFYPLVTRRPVIEREVELRVLHDKGRDGRLHAGFVWEF
jgi:hypothetical protein